MIAVSSGFGSSGSVTVVYARIIYANSFPYNVISSQRLHESTPRAWYIRGLYISS